MSGSREVSLQQPLNDETDREIGASGLRLEERIYQELLGRIRNGVYALGSRLPTEHELCAEYGVSRPVVRAALARLREAGLVVSRRGAGSFVSAGDAEISTGLSPVASIDDIAGYYAFRRLIEGESAASAARRRDARHLEEMEALLSDLDAKVEAGEETIESDNRFHLAVARASGNRFLQETFVMLRPHMMFVGRFVRSLSSVGYVRSKRVMQGEHRQLLEAIAAGDPEAARAAMNEHISASERRIFKGTGNED